MLGCGACSLPGVAAQGTCFLNVSEEGGCHVHVETTSLACWLSASPLCSIRSRVLASGLAQPGEERHVSLGPHSGGVQGAGTHTGSKDVPRNLPCLVRPSGPSSLWDLLPSVPRGALNK
jgi:hypothetical protein